VVTAATGFLLLACGAGQLILGPIDHVWAGAKTWQPLREERARKRAFLAAIPENASVLVPLPYLTHFALREHCYSLHYVLKGLKTLSRARYEPPPPPEFVLIDYADTATFHAFGGFYHPKMETTDGATVPSSDRLLHELLRQAAWRVETDAELALLVRQPGSTAPAIRDPAEEESAIAVGPTAQLRAVGFSASHDASRGSTLRVALSWAFPAEREVFPWLELALVRETDQKRVVFTKGLCAPQAGEGAHDEAWHIPSLGKIGAGTYAIEARFYDNTYRSLWAVEGNPRADEQASLGPPLSLGRLSILPDGQVRQEPPEPRSE
jgi:hypothetical protein